MANNIIALTGERPDFLPPAVISEGGGIDEFAGGISAGGMPLPMLSIRGKQFRLRKDGEEMPLPKPHAYDLDVVFVRARATVSKRFYEEGYTSGETSSPDCSSVDGKTPDVAEPIASACATCPKNAWGSATKNGKPSAGKACSDYKRIVVYPVGLAAEGLDPSPVVIDLPSTSLRAPKGTKMTMLREYVKVLGQNGVDPTQYVVTLSFTDAEFPQIQFTPKRYVTADEYAHIKALTQDDLVAEVVEGDVAEAEGKITLAQTLPGTKPAHIEGEEGTSAPKKAPPKKAPPKKAPPKKAPPKPEPEAVEAADEASDEDLMAELRGLLG